MAFSVKKKFQPANMALEILRIQHNCKTSGDLVFEKSAYTKPKSKSAKLANDKKEY